MAEGSQDEQLAILGFLGGQKNWAGFVAVLEFWVGKG
jgi:hypothetical protein